jgi:hypothetical protein
MMTSPCLDRPLLPLAVALPQMIEKIEAELPTTEPTEKRRLHRRADLIRDLLGQARHGIRSPIDQGSSTHANGWQIATAGRAAIANDSLP